MLKRLHRRIEFAFQRVETLAAIVGGCAIVLVMVLVSADAVLRRVFASPLTFQLPLSENYLLVAAVMLSLAWGYRQGGAIQVRLLLDRLPKRAGAIFVRVGLAVSTIYMAVLAGLSWTNFYRALVDHEVVMGVIDWPVSWSLVWVPLGCCLLAIRLALDACEPDLRRIGHSIDEVLHAEPAEP